MAAADFGEVGMFRRGRMNENQRYPACAAACLSWLVMGPQLTHWDPDRESRRSEGSIQVCDAADGQTPERAALSPIQAL